MTAVRTRMGWIALAIAFSPACTAEWDESPGRRVAVTTQELGGYSQLFTISLGEMTSFRIYKAGPTYTLVFTPTNGPGCGTLGALHTQTGVGLPMAFMPCMNITAATSESAVLAADSLTRTIYRLVVSDGAGGAAGTGGSPQGTWVPVTTVNADVRSIVSNGTDLWWADASSRIHRVNIASGVETATSSTSTGELLAVEGPWLYVNAKQSDGTYQLRLVSLNLVGFFVMARNSVTFDESFAFDSASFYWTEFVANGTNRLRSVPKSGGALVTVKSSSSVWYDGVVTSGSALYWIETNLNTGVRQFRRKNLANGNHTSVRFPFDGHHVSGMKLLPTGIYFATKLYQPTNFSDFSFVRTSL